MYKTVLVYDEEGNFLGRGIKKDGADRLQSINLYTDAEGDQLNEALGRLNESVQLHETWPDAHDPEVRNLLLKEDFFPVEMSEQEVIDEDNSYLVYKKATLTAGEPDEPELDAEQSVVKYKKIMAPTRPSDVMERTKKAQEIIARQRAGHPR